MLNTSDKYLARTVATTTAKRKGSAQMLTRSEELEKQVVSTQAAAAGERPKMLELVARAKFLKTSIEAELSRQMEVSLRAAPGRVRQNYCKPWNRCRNRLYLVLPALGATGKYHRRYQHSVARRGEVR